MKYTIYFKKKCIRCKQTLVLLATSLLFYSGLYKFKLNRARCPVTVVDHPVNKLKPIVMFRL